MASTRVILPQDTAMFDASSFDSGSQVITQDMPRIGGINWTGATNTPNLTLLSDIQVYGSQTFISAMTVTGTGYVNYYKRGTVDITSNNITATQEAPEITAFVLKFLNSRVPKIEGIALREIGVGIVKSTTSTVVNPQFIYLLNGAIFKQYL